MNNLFERNLPISYVPKIKKIEIIVENIGYSTKLSIRINQLKQIFTFDSLHYLF